MVVIAAREVVEVVGNAFAIGVGKALGLRDRPPWQDGRAGGGLQQHMGAGLRLQCAPEHKRRVHEFPGAQHQHPLVGRDAGSHLGHRRRRQLHRPVASQAAKTAVVKERLLARCGLCGLCGRGHRCLCRAVCTAGRGMGRERPRPVQQRAGGQGPPHARLQAGARCTAKVGDRRQVHPLDVWRLAKTGVRQVHKGVAGADLVVHQHQRPRSDKLRVQHRVGGQVQEHLWRVAVAFFKCQRLCPHRAVAAGVQVQGRRAGVLALPGIEHALPQPGGGFGHADEQHRTRLRAKLRRNAAGNALVAVLHHRRRHRQVLGQHAADKQKGAARVVARCQHKQLLHGKFTALHLQMQRAGRQGVRFKACRGAGTGRRRRQAGRGWLHGHRTGCKGRRAHGNTVARFSSPTRRPSAIGPISRPS